MKAQLTATKITAVAVTALCIVFAPSARACGNPAKGAGLNGLRLAPKLALGGSRLLPNTDAAQAGAPAAEGSPLIVGMWEITQYAGGVLYDHAIQQLFADGNELQNSSVFPPEVGNVCFGVWKQENARTFKMKHYGWLFENGQFTGTFILTATVTVGTPGNANTYFGTFAADVLLPSGQTDPTQHVTGTVQAVRLTVD